MKALFVHDHTFYIKKNDVFSPGKLTYSSWKLYLEVFEKIKVVGRSLPLDNANSSNMDLSSGANVSFSFMPNISTIRGILFYKSKVVNMINKHIKSSDAVIARTSILGNIAALLAEKNNKPWVIEVVNCPWDALWNYGNLKGKLLAPFAYLKQKETTLKAPYAIYVTQKFLQDRYPCRGISAGISDVNINLSDPSVLDIRLQRASNPSKPIVFGLIGSLKSKYKGIQTAFEALSKAAKRIPEFELRIIGDGDQVYWKKLADSQGIKDNVKFMGVLPSGDPILKWIDEVDVCLQPSFQEGLPRSLVEALSRGCPSIGSTAGGIPELLEPSVLHQPGDAEKLCGLIMKSIDSDWRVEQAKKNFETAKLYNKELLDSKRKIFWNDFAKYARQKYL